MKTIFVLFAAMQASAALASSAEIPSVLAHPIFGQPYACTEHWQGNLKELGDALGTDPAVLRSKKGVTTENRDVDGDGDIDLVVFADVATLKATGELSATTTRLVLRADQTDRRQIIAQAPVQVTP